MIEKKFLLHHIDMAIAHQNLLLLKQKFSHTAFLQHRVETKPGESKYLYRYCWCLLKMLIIV